MRPEPLHTCPVCEYDIRGLASDECPECGTRLTREAWITRRPSALFAATLSGFLITGCLLSSTGVLAIIGVPFILAGFLLAGSIPPEAAVAARRRLRWLAVVAWTPLLLVIAGLVLLVVL